ncbi:MAG: 2-C-methyl-D-erythritol 2,4-cyclodiphosphate synthase [Gammaproteobacteria bacterium]|nr:MAG: 2-C-methyl-D-erythritol 2,4-cyclodiphosphate synthase [Gammaproteobacteria bacterium]
MRIGHGYDAHRFGEGRRLVLGGVTIEHHLGLIAHSDGDAVIHALCDALVGAVGLGDLGQHFPETDPKYKDVDSRVLLRDVMEKLHALGYTVANVDLTIVAEQPRMAPHVDAMRENLASDLGIDGSRVNIKATTTEGMGFAGRSEGIAAHAVVLVNE